MKVAIVGPGALGLLIASRFSRAGIDVRLIDDRPERAHDLDRTGIRYQGSEGEGSYSIPVTVSLNDPTDLVVVCVKGHATEKAAVELARSNYQGAILTLQNGLGHVEMLNRHLPTSPILAGTTSAGATLLAAGSVRDLGQGETVIGCTSVGAPARSFIDQCLTLFREGGFSIRLVDPIAPVLWGKLLINVGINPLTALLGVANGELLKSEPAHELMAALIREAESVAKAQNISLPYADAVSEAEAVCRATAGNLSSMYQDLLRGNRTEIDFINGAIAQAGKAAGIPCPKNEAVTLLIQSLERAWESRTWQELVGVRFEGRLAEGVK